MNTIVANNLGANCVFHGQTLMVTFGGNLDSDNTCKLATAQLDTIGVNPLLGPLQNNGGPTQTHALLKGSPAIDAGSSTSPFAPCPAVDQRGFLRPMGMECDIGAYEAGEIIFSGAIPPPKR